MAGEGKSWFKRNIADFSGDDEVPEEPTTTADKKDVRTFKAPPGVSGVGKPSPVTIQGGAILDRYKKGAAKSKVVITSQVGDQDVDEEYFENIMAALGEVEMGVGFTVFVQLFLKLKSKLSEEEAMQMAFETVQASHSLTKTEILAALDAQSARLAEEEETFNSAIEKDAESERAQSTKKSGEFGRDLEAAQEELRQLEEAYTSGKRELTQKITTLGKQKREADETVANLDQNVLDTKAAFAAAAKAVAEGSTQHNWLGISRLRELITTKVKEE